MAAPSKSKTAAKGKDSKKKSRRLADLYTLGEKISRKNKTCPKCGPGMFLGQHTDRIVCGKCQYVEYGKKG